MSIDLYFVEGSPPCSLVLLVAEALELKFNRKIINTFAKEQYSPEFLKLNPQHTVPTIVDNGFPLWESRAICRYLLTKYGKGSSLYPEDPQTRAVIEQRLDFDLGTLYNGFAAYLFPQLFAGTAPNEAAFQKLDDALKVLNTFLEGQDYAAGSTLTLADLALVVSVSTIEAGDISLEPYPNVVRWYQLVKSTAKNYEEANGKNVAKFAGLVKRVLNPEK